MKVCRKCGVEKDSSNFYTSKTNNDGLCSYCKKCQIANVTKSFKKFYNTDKYKERIKKYGNKYDKIFKLKHKEEIKEKRKIYKINNPEKIKARQKVLNSVYKKKIFRQPCCVCGNPKVEGHHEDYGKPLEIIWVCKKHHIEIHQKNRLIISQT